MYILHVIVFGCGTDSNCLRRFQLYNKRIGIYQNLLSNQNVIFCSTHAQAAANPILFLSLPLGATRVMNTWMYILLQYITIHKIVSSSRWRFLLFCQKFYWHDANITSMCSFINILTISSLIIDNIIYCIETFNLYQCFHFHLMTWENHVYCTSAYNVSLTSSELLRIVQYSFVFAELEEFFLCIKSLIHLWQCSKIPWQLLD
jgi:hypothetical protein